MMGVQARLPAGMPASGGAFASERTDLGVIGRWAGGLLRGRWRHADASGEDPGTLDVPLGLVTHYLTGIALTEAFVLVPWRRPAPMFAAAVAYGIATSVLPLFVLFPSLGYGPAGLRSGEAARLARIMLVGHTAFGAGIGLGTGLLVARRS
jgi:hypothetical protein